MRALTVQSNLLSAAACCRFVHDRIAGRLHQNYCREGWRVLHFGGFYHYLPKAAASCRTPKRKILLEFEGKKIDKVY